MKRLIFLFFLLFQFSIAYNLIYGSDKSHLTNEDYQNSHEEKHYSDTQKHDEEGHDDHEKHKEGNHEDHDEEDEESHEDHGRVFFGEGKAMVEVKEEGKHFRLSKGAINTIKLQSIKLDSPSKGIFEVPASSIVDFQDKIGIYKQNGDWFELVEVSLIQRDKHSAQINSNGISVSDYIVNRGAALLRIAHLQASGPGGQGHAH